MYLVPLHPCTVYPLVPYICTRAFPPSMQSSALLSCSVLCTFTTYNCHYFVYYTDTYTTYFHNHKETHRECCQSLIEYLYDMAPSKARAGHDDSRSEASSTREKQNAGHTTTTTKGRRGAAHGAGNSSSLRDVTTASSVMAAAAAGASNASNQEANVGVSIYSLSGIPTVADHGADTVVNTR